MVWTSPVIPWDQCGPQRRKALRVAWLRGNLRYKLHPSQQEVYDQIKASWGTVQSSMERVFGLDVSRQWGKDFLSAVLAVETIYKHKLNDTDARIPYAAPTQDGVKKLLVPTLERVFDDCPPDMRPKEIGDGSFVRSANTLTLPGGKQVIQMVGCDLHPEYLRGPSSVAAFFSECGFMSIMSTLGIVLPQLLWHPDAFVVCNSSPPDTPAHEWDSEFLPERKAAGMYATRNIYDNPALTDEQIEGAFNAPGFGGKTGDRSRRELLCEHIANSDLTVVPEWAFVRGVETGSSYDGGCVVAREPPKYRDCYVAMDPGWSDLCAVLFAYWDFERAVLVIEDDFAVARANSEKVAQLIRDKERELWGVAWEEVPLTEDERLRAPSKSKKWVAWSSTVTAWRNGAMANAPHKRVSDTDLRMIGDMTTIHNMPFQPTRKDDRDAQINSLRLRIGARKIEVHPRARGTIAHLDHAIWNKSRTEFERSGKFGHFDLVAALVYLDRNVDRDRNPMPPPLYGVDTSNMLVLPHQKMVNVDPLTKMFPGVAKRHALKQRERGRRV